MSWIAITRWKTGMGWCASTVPFDTQHDAEAFAAQRRSVGLNCCAEEYRPALVVDGECMQDCDALNIPCPQRTTHPLPEKKGNGE